MGTLLIGVRAIVIRLIAFHTYGPWLARRSARLNPDTTSPGAEVNWRSGYVSTRRKIVFGHGLASIGGGAGAGL